MATVRRGSSLDVCRVKIGIQCREYNNSSYHGLSPVIELQPAQTIPHPAEKIGVLFTLFGG